MPRFNFCLLCPRSGKGPYAALLLGALAATISISGSAITKLDPPWIAKDWTQWTINDCDKVLRHSPWVTYYEYDDSGIYNTQNSRQFRSARPIRQALSGSCSSKNTTTR